MSHRIPGRAALWPALGLLCAVGGALGVALVLAFGVREQAPSAERGATLAPEHASAASPEPSGGDASGAPTAVARHESSNESDVIVRVVDAAGAPLAGLPVVLVEPVEAGAPWFGAPDGLQPPRPGGTSSDSLAFDMDTGLGAPLKLKSPSTRASERTPAELQRHVNEVLSARLSHWPLEGEPATLEFSRELLAQATTDAQGEARLAWDRRARPLVQVIYAFPTRSRGAADLDARTAASPARLELRAPELARVHLRATQDLEASSGARWRARIATRLGGTGPGQRNWAAWHAPRSLDEGAVVELVWERGLDARLEAAVDAPLASLLLFPLANDAAPTSLALRASEHYSLLRGTVHDAAGSPLGGAAIELRRAAARSQSPRFPVDRTQLVLDDQGRFTVWAPSAPRQRDAIELAIFAVDAKDSRSRMEQREVKIARRPSSTSVLTAWRDAELDASETYVELTAPDPAGFVRELGVLRLGDGPCVVAGRVLWESGEPIAQVKIYLPRRASSSLMSEMERLVVDEQGRFRRLGVPGRETIELIVNAPELPRTQSFSVEAGRRDLELRLPHRGALAGRLLLDAWAPIEIVVRAANGEELEAKSSANGAFEVHGVPFGICAVELRSGGVVLRRVDGVELAQRGMAHPEALREIDLRPHTTIVKLELRNAQRRALKNRPFELVASASAFHLRGSSLDDGSCAVVLPRGIERAELRVEGFRAQELPLDRERIAVELIVAR
ncbi:MAG: hypothetical protein JNM84_03170 [Planctomycetes bacterium]|nr:hypothetical protein [Planctomycetota bacterium]